MEFSERDADNLAKAKEAIGTRAAEGDIQAAAVFASLLNAETERSKAVAAPGQAATVGELGPWTAKTLSGVAPSQAASETIAA